MAQELALLPQRLAPFPGILTSLVDDACDIQGAPDRPGNQYHYSKGRSGDRVLGQHSTWGPSLERDFAEHERQRCHRDEPAREHEVPAHAHDVERVDTDDRGREPPLLGDLPPAGLIARVSPPGEDREAPQQGTEWQERVAGQIQPNIRQALRDPHVPSRLRVV